MLWGKKKFMCMWKYSSSYLIKTDQQWIYQKNSKISLRLALFPIISTVDLRSLKEVPKYSQRYSWPCVCCVLLCQVYVAVPPAKKRHKYICTLHACRTHCAHINKRKPARMYTFSLWTYLSHVHIVVAFCGLVGFRWIGIRLILFHYLKQLKEMKINTVLAHHHIRSTQCAEAQHATRQSHHTQSHANL